MYFLGRNWEVILKCARIHCNSRTNPSLSGVRVLSTLVEAKTDCEQDEKSAGARGVQWGYPSQSPKPGSVPSLSLHTPLPGVLTRGPAIDKYWLWNCSNKQTNSLISLGRGVWFFIEGSGFLSGLMQQLPPENLLEPGEHRGFLYTFAWMLLNPILVPSVPDTGRPLSLSPYCPVCLLPRLTRSSVMKTAAIRY